MTKPLARCIAVFGTASDVGKSTVATALCRILSNRGHKVAPFKAQNMSNNSYVSLSQGELARAQAVQAEAARVEPTVDMNPVLLKPSSDQTSQVIIRGQAIGNRDTSAYFRDTRALKQLATQSLDRIRAEFDAVVIEGAGSCAEVNLRPCDFANFEMAHHANAPALLVADIDRGGVFAQIVGTLDVLPPDDRSRVRGFIINRFRGDLSLFDDGIRYIEERTALPVLGVIPWMPDMRIDSEDGSPEHAIIDPRGNGRGDSIRVGVLLLPRISNFTDFAPLDQAGVAEVHYLRSVRQLSGYDLVLIPGSKNTRSDLEWLRDQGWSEELHRYRQHGGRIGGICGGYQMLGESVSDPDGIEGEAGTTLGLGLLPLRTILHREKRLHRVKARWCPSSSEVAGYEIHHGETQLLAGRRPALRIWERDGAPCASEDGAMSDDGRVWGCYIHGLFDRPDFRHALFESLGKPVARPARSEAGNFDDRQAQYDRLAEHFENHVDIERLFTAIGFA